jgi:signal transduction histidine kinase
MSTTFPAPRDPARDPEHPLARAFASFTEAAGSLEHTYEQLQAQVAHLGQELEATNRDLAASLEENHRIRERREQQALVEVSAQLAHEIRKPLGSLELFAGLLAEANLEAESHRWTEQVQASLRTLSSTVKNVLNLHNAPSPEPAPIDAGQLLDWAYDFLLPLAKQSRVEMQVINGLNGVIIQADRERLEQVLLNLALNAFRFMPGGGWLSLHGVVRFLDFAAPERSSSEGMEIVMRDTGPGIAPNDLPRIFDAGFTTRPGSRGLGLAVCRRILEQHGGSIAAESRPGYGASFRLRLPR